MGEPEAIKSIRLGEVQIQDKTFTIHKELKGGCTDCYFSDTLQCPPTATKICTTGGNILKLK